MRVLPINNYQTSNNKNLSFGSVKASTRVMFSLLERFPDKLIKLDPEDIYEIEHVEERIPGCLSLKPQISQAIPSHYYLITEGERKAVTEAAIPFEDTMDKARAMANKFKEFINRAREITEDMLGLSDDELRKIVFEESSETRQAPELENVISFVTK